MIPITWAYGVTTVPERRNTTLPVTLESLKRGGFPTPRLFIDGWEGKDSLYADLGLEYSSRFPAMLPFGNWTMTAVELYLRNPKASRYAIFQDDFVTYRNLRQYLEKLPYPSNGYCNLYTAFRLNEPVIQGKGPGWYEAGLLNPHDPQSTLQGGKGAVALMFSNEAMVTLLSQHSMLLKPKASDRRMATRRVDGGIVTAMNHAGLREYIHSPSLVQHIGYTSSCGNGPQALAQTFLGEGHDAMEFIKEKSR